MFLRPSIYLLTRPDIFRWDKGARLGLRGEPLVLFGQTPLGPGDLGLLRIMRDDARSKEERAIR